MTAAYNYFHVTNFFWMFGEGCYLHTAVVLTYSTDRLRKWMFICIGWGERASPLPRLGHPPPPRPGSGQVRVVECAHSPLSLLGDGDSGNISGEPLSTWETPAHLWALGCTGVFWVCIPDSTDRSCDAGLSPGVPFPIIVAWAIGKLYYDNEK